MSSPLLLASVADNGDAAVLASGAQAVDAGTTDALLAELMRTRAPLGDARIRIVASPDAAVLASAATAATRFSAAGYPVDAIVVTRVPRKADGWPGAWGAAQRARVAGFAAASPVPVMAVALRPKARAVPRRIDPAPQRVLPAAGQPAVEGEGFRWDVPVDGLASVRDLQVAKDGGDLRIRLDGADVRRPLPAVLARCVPVSAEETETGLAIAFAKDPAAWPAEGT